MCDGWAVLSFLGCLGGFDTEGGGGPGLYLAFVLCFYV